MAFIQSRDYSVIIPIKIADQTATGAKSTRSSVDSMLKEQLRAIESASRAQIADERRTATEIAQIQATQARREIASRLADFREIQKIHADKLKMVAQEASAKKAADDKYTREAMADMKRMAAERARIMQENVRATERAAKQEAAAQLREARRATSEWQQTILPALRNQAGQQQGGGWLQSILGGVAGGAAFSAIQTGLGWLKSGLQEVISIVPEAVSALFEFTKAGAEVEMELKRDSEMVNFSVETLSSLRVAAKDLKIDYEKISVALGIFDKNLLVAREGHNALSEVFKENSIDIYDNEKALNQFINVLFHTEDGAKQTGLALQVFGRGGRALVAIAKEMGGDLEAFKEVLRSTGLLLGGEGANAAHEFDKALVLLDLQVEALKIRLAHDLMPVFQYLITLARDFVSTVGPALTKWIADQQSYWTNVGNGVKFFTDRIKEISNVAKPATTDMVILNGVAVQQSDLLEKVGVAAKESFANMFWGATRAMQPLLLVVDAARGVLNIFEKIGSYTATPALAAVQVAKSKFDPSQSLSSLLGIGKSAAGTPEQVEAATAVMDKLREAVEKTQREVETFGHTTALQKFTDSIMEMKLQNLPGYLIAEANGYLAAGAAAAKRLDQLEAQKKAQEKFLQEQKKAQEEVIATGNSLDQQISEMTEKHRQLNAEIGKSPDALKDYDTWLSKQSQSFKDLIDKTPALTSKLQALRDEAKAFSDDQAQAGYAAILKKVSDEAARYADTGKEAETTSEKLRNEFTASGLAARLNADQVNALTKAIDDLSKKEKDAAAERARQATEALQKDTMRGISGLSIDLDRLISGRAETRVESLVHSLQGLAGLRIGESAFGPLSSFVKTVVADPQGLTVGTKALSSVLGSLNMINLLPSTATNMDAFNGIIESLVRTAPGIPVERIQEATAAIKALLLTSAGLDTPQGRAMLRQSDQAKNLRDDLEASQQEIALATEGSAMRQQIAYQKAYNEIKLADQTAVESQIASQVKLGDATVLHSQQVRATVMDHLASQTTITEAFGSGIVSVYDKVTGFIDKGISKLTHGLSIVNDVLSSIAHQLVSRLFQRFLDAFFPASGGGQAAQAGGSGGGGFGSILRGIFGGGGGGVTGTPPFVGNFAGGGGGLGVLASLTQGFGGMASPASLTSGVNSPWRGFANSFPGAMPGATGFSMAGLGASLAGIAPLLGVGLGTSLGGQSRFGQVLGGIGGGIAGLGIAALLGSSTAAGLFGSIGTLGGLLSFSLPLLPIAGALIIGAIILKKKQQRDKDEKARAELQAQADTSLFSILAAVKTDQMDGPTATAAIAKLHEDWITAGNAMKDSKTRNIHLKAWDDFKPIIDAINKEIEAQAGRANARLRMAPVFASGGYNARDQFIKVRPGEGIQYPGTRRVQTIPGRDMGYDSQYMYAPAGTRIIPNSEMRNPEHHAHGGTVGDSGGSNTPNITATVVIDRDGLATIMLQSPLFKDAVIHNVKVGKMERKI